MASRWNRQSQRALVDKLHIVGAGASIATDTAIRGLVRRSLGRAGSVLTYRFMPIAPIVTSALTNAAITYTVGKRAQAVAKSGGDTMFQASCRRSPALDERRVFEWTMNAIKGSTGALSNAFAKIKSALTSRRAPQRIQTNRRNQALEEIDRAACAVDVVIDQPVLPGCRKNSPAS